MMMRFNFKFWVVTSIYALVLFSNCNNSSQAPPLFDPNDCTEKSCPLHRDKMNVGRDHCLQCGMPINNYSTISTILNRTAQSVYDSVFVYHHRVLQNSIKIGKVDTNSVEEKKQYFIDASTNLEKAKLAHQNLKYLVLGKHKAILKPHNKKIEKLYALATYRLTVIGNELEKQNIDQAKVIIYTEELNKTLYEINNEQRVLKIKISN